MGYEVHITRKREWSDDEGPSISLDEWLAYIKSDSDMRHDGAAEASNPAGEVIRVEKEGIAVWTAYSGHEMDGNMAWFCHFGDRVSVKNPDTEILRKMYDVSVALGAQVQGDEGEIYDEAGESNWEELRGDPPAKPWWKFWG